MCTETCKKYSIAKIVSYETNDFFGAKHQSINRFSQKLIGSWFLFDFGVRFINKNKIRFILLHYNFYNLRVHELNTKLHFSIKKQYYVMIVLLETILYKDSTFGNS